MSDPSTQLTLPPLDRVLRADFASFVRASFYELAPGLELQSGPWRIFADVAVPVYQRVNGNQLTAPVLFKAMLTRSF